ncbi:carbonic anhydrase-related protein 10-like [Antedon mediterranea]|uniref:carbonic anhydrase-related protein 10-like n=1 Tax=Antedon mediterranea TaxID=105859 RepID=UPI003AF84A61
MFLELVLLGLLSTCTANTGVSEESEDQFKHWWHYCGIYGPEKWSTLRGKGLWKMCMDGKNQSPVDLQASRLIFDRTLDGLKFDGENELSGKIKNTGHHLQFETDTNSNRKFRVFGGPLDYSYTLTTIRLHFGNTSQRGSEHLVNGKAFPGEVQLMFFNNLYEDYNTARSKPNGLAVISIFTQLGNTTNTELDKLTSRSVLRELVYSDTFIPLSRMNVRELLPLTTDYITYQGSLTTPPCSETVIWMILNKPIYIEPDKFSLGLRELKTYRKENPEPNPLKGTMMNNFRPPFGLGNRILRTNIFMQENQDERCPVSKRVVVYKVNEGIMSPSNTRS